jgi:hypothetical protein
MRKQETKIETEIKAYSSVVYPGKSFSTEELFAYEYTSDQDVFVQSQNAWSQLISSAIDVDQDLLARVMKPWQNTLKQKPHSDVIYNIEDVVSALKNAIPPLDHYLRV